MGLRSYVERMSAALEGRALADVAHTLAVGREPQRVRLAVVGESASEVRRGWDDYLAGGQDLTGRVPPGKRRGPMRTLLPGQSAAELAELGAAWVAGKCELDSQLGRPVSLPTYPFARKRFWIALEQPVDTPAISTNGPVEREVTILSLLEGFDG